MSRRILCIVLMSVVLFTAFIPFAKADEVTLYASDGRTRTVEQDDVERWKNVGWFETREEAQIITMYATDGRTIEIPEFYREAFRQVGWYNTREEVVQTMYSMDGRILEVYKDSAEAHHKVGWYYNLSDVSVIMYDEQGAEHRVVMSDIEKELKNGLFLKKNDAMQLMFSADGRFIHVKHADVKEYENVGWYRAGGKIDPSRPMVAITFDDGPGKYTDAVLSILEKYNSRATFFVQGKVVSSYKDTLKRAISLGNEIGNHTWSHVNLSSSSSAVIAEQIRATNNAVFNATGVYPKLYRPPYGAYNDFVLSSIGMPAILWSVDTLDWKTRSPQKTLESVKQSTHDGSIILMHDIHKPTLDSVESVVRHLLMQKFQLVTVSELISSRQGQAVSGRIYRRVNP